MNQQDLVAAIVVSHTLSQEMADDYVEVWMVAWHLRRALPGASDRTIADLGEAILAGLLAVGATIGDLDPDSGQLLPWTPEGAVRRTMSEWRALGRDPNMGEIGWLGPGS
jgi:hypothetical protein